MTTAAAFNRALEGINGMSRKVFDAVPIAKPWTKAQIVAELRRTGCVAAANVVEGCLNTLRGRGLISEPERGYFKRVEPRMPTPAAPLPEEPSMAQTSAPGQTPAQSTKPDPLMQFAELAKKARQIASQLNDLAEDIEDASLAAEERVQTLNADTAKLGLLRQVLKGIAE